MSLVSYLHPFLSDPIIPFVDLRLRPRPPSFLCHPLTCPRVRPVIPVFPTVAPRHPGRPVGRVVMSFGWLMPPAPGLFPTYIFSLLYFICYIDSPRWSLSSRLLFSFVPRLLLASERAVREKLSHQGKVVPSPALFFSSALSSTGVSLCQSYMFRTFFSYSCCI